MNDDGGGGDVECCRKVIKIDSSLEETICVWDNCCRGYHLLSAQQENTLAV